MKRVISILCLMMLLVALSGCDSSAIQQHQENNNDTSIELFQPSKSASNYDWDLSASEITRIGNDHIEEVLTFDGITCQEWLDQFGTGQDVRAIPICVAMSIYVLKSDEEAGVAMLNLLLAIDQDDGIRTSLLNLSRKMFDGLVEYAEEFPEVPVCMYVMNRGIALD